MNWAKRKLVVMFFRDQTFGPSWFGWTITKWDVRVCIDVSVCIYVYVYIRSVWFKSSSAPCPGTWKEDPVCLFHWPAVLEGRSSVGSECCVSQATPCPSDRKRRCIQCCWHSGQFSTVSIELIWHWSGCYWWLPSTLPYACGCASHCPSTSFFGCHDALCI